MASHFDNTPAHHADSATEASGREPGLLETAKSLGKELHGSVHDHLVLAALETRQAGESLVQIIAMGVMMASMLLTAWLALVSAGLFVLVERSIVSAGLALLLVFALHGLLAVVLLFAIRRRSRSLLFPSTISRLQPAAGSSSDASP